MHLLFDIGGTNMRISASYNEKNFVEPKIFKTPEDFSKGLNILLSAAQLFSKGKHIDAVCGGIAGPLDKSKKMLINSPHLKRWVRNPLKGILEKKLRTKVFLENDTALVGLGEATHGAGRKNRIVAYMTISTGVNGVRIVDGQIDRNAFGFEIGHQLICLPESRHRPAYCPGCQELGHLEGFISGTALEKKYKKHPRLITDKNIWDDVAKKTSYGLVNTIVYWSPDVIVLGGSMMKHPGIPMEKIKKYVKRYASIFPHVPPIKKATLGDFGGLYGALTLLKNPK